MSTMEMAWVWPLVVTGTTAGPIGPHARSHGYRNAIKGYGAYPVCTNFILGAAIQQQAPGRVLPHSSPMTIFCPASIPTPGGAL